MAKAGPRQIYATADVLDRSNTLFATTALEPFKTRRFVIAGHTDTQPIRGGKFKNNWYLSTARAISVLQFLVDAGFAAKNLAAAGYGEFDPIAGHDTPQNRAQNRRMAIILVPNKSREKVFMKEIVADDTFRRTKAKLPMAIGKDIEGGPAVVDLARMPHLLVAGTTGSGKSVAVNAMITSLLYSSSPEDVRFIMVDPKMLELSIYEGIPHLLLPVVTDPKKANLALRWAVDEMERRYDLLAHAGVRDITGYNDKIGKARAKWEAEQLRRAADAAEAAVNGSVPVDDDQIEQVEYAELAGPLAQVVPIEFAAIRGNDSGGVAELSVGTSPSGPLQLGEDAVLR